MSTNAQLAAQLLRDAGSFFRDVGQQNPEISEQMNDNAQVYDQVAQMVETDPNGQLPVQEEGGEAQQ
ncbi:hypothetical protein [Altericroceibacterium endophyticum]|uniref:Uncharacterized protein n=1 Tax=Altericroceibacterium endophyticum TaxID=1808508 RepID=A0A6I4T7A9_9SPHN|nr:hypothetical protein [Altericroceibacterium endophyticum]MXO66558.1 hypothetical protein [Altericroceibacterium endophyticum]